MVKKVHQIMGIPSQFSGNDTPEYPHLPDEDNRNAPVMERAEKSTASRIRRIMLLLGTAGLTTLGILFPSSSGIKAEAKAEVTPSPVVAVSPTATPMETAVPTSVPTPVPTDSPAPSATPLPLRNSGTIHIVVYADLDNPDYDWFNPDPALSPLMVLADDTIEESSFESYTLPPLPALEDYTAVGYVMQTVETEAFIYDEVPLQVYPLTDKLLPEHVLNVPVGSDGERYVEIHTLWRYNKDSERTVILDGVSYSYNSPIASEGLCYLAAYPVPSRENMTFLGWYDEEGNRVDVLTYFDFYPPSDGEPAWWLEGASERVLFLENRDWSNPQPVVLHSEWN